MSGIRGKGSTFSLVSRSSQRGGGNGDTPRPGGRGLRRNEERRVRGPKVGRIQASVDEVAGPVPGAPKKGPRRGFHYSGVMLIDQIMDDSDRPSGSQPAQASAAEVAGPVPGAPKKASRSYVSASGVMLLHPIEEGACVNNPKRQLPFPKGKKRCSVDTPRPKPKRVALGASGAGKNTFPKWGVSPRAHRYLNRYQHAPLDPMEIVTPSPKKSGLRSAGYTPGVPMEE
ncbi:hypothetical protein DID77_00140 [Candidatus Marinamargulisbacteria bacterium SCGC AG-439-L15]|nr:hypothetical protein DID77_00140 [Candidatus Marinamargulisbacteria bacterium SCGC AG-439-L15]